jgi:hypothetical protein
MYTIQFLMHDDVAGRSRPAAQCTFVIDASALHRMQANESFGPTGDRKKNVRESDQQPLQVE